MELTLSAYKGAAHGANFVFKAADMHDHASYELDLPRFHSFCARLAMEGVHIMRENDYGHMLLLCGPDDVKVFVLMRIGSILQAERFRLVMEPEMQEDGSTPAGVVDWLTPAHIVTLIGNRIFKEEQEAWADDGCSPGQIILELDSLLQDEENISWGDNLVLRSSKLLSISNPDNAEDMEDALPLAREWRFWDTLDSRVYLTACGVMLDKEFEAYAASFHVPQYDADFQYIYLSNAVH